MRINAQGIICPACGETLGYMGTLTWRPTWLGYTRTISHMCPMNTPEFICYMLLFDEQENFVAIMPGGDRFISRAGEPVYTAVQPEDIPF